VRKHQAFALTPRAMRETEESAPCLGFHVLEHVRAPGGQAHAAAHAARHLLHLGLRRAEHGRGGGRRRGKLSMVLVTRNVPVAPFDAMRVVCAQICGRVCDQDAGWAEARVGVTESEVSARVRGWRVPGKASGPVAGTMP
jgi:hypothetical protein